MRARNHVIVSAGISAGLQVTLHSWPATLGCFFSGIMIDIDHYLEYYLVYNKFPRYKELVDFCSYNTEGKVYLYFHAYEYIFVLWFLIFYFHIGMVWLGIALGLTTHMAFDQFTNPIKPLFYFITFRIKNRFLKSKILSEAYYQRSLL